jgi:hypothetical protein
MPDLQHDAPARPMHRLGREAPAVNLGLAVDAGFMPEGGVALHRHRGLRDQQASTRPLGVVLGHQGAGHMVVFRPAAGEGRHPDPVGCLQGADAQRGEQVGHAAGATGLAGGGILLQVGASALKANGGRKPLASACWSP